MPVMTNPPHPRLASSATDAGPRPTGAPDAYLRAKVQTATPEQLQLMLYDGAVRFAEQGRQALADKDFDRSFDRLSRAQRIVGELQQALRPDRAPDVCKNMDALYTFIYMRLVEANATQDPALVDEATGLLKYQRETWVLLMQQTTRQKQTAASAVLPTASAPAQRMERLSIAV
jgi:flagellar protein FliS